MDMPKNPTSDNKTIPQLEDEIIKFWKENKIFEKSVEKNPEDNLYVFYDGPPFISGLPHYGHLLGSIAKDLVPRYWTMKGKRVERVWGWDAHGLTVENRVQDRLGIKNRRDIESYGLAKFTQACYEYTSQVSAEWEWYVDKIGRWVDFKNAYRTTDQKYMESVIWAFKQLYDHKNLYEGVRVSLYCPVCGTPVSDFEIAMDDSYREETDPSITVKFKVVSDGIFKDKNILAWTTTPWTLPSNRALVVDEKEKYVDIEFEGQAYILAKSRLETVFKDKEYKINNEFQGSTLVGIKYEPLYEFFASKAGEFQVYSYEGMVNMQDGTGVVHSAPGFGEIDTEMGKHYGLTLMMTLDDEGKFLPGDSGKNPYERMFYLQSNEPILKDLEERKIIFSFDKVKHRVPYHDRCNTLLVQKAQNSWFIDVQKIKQDLIKNNQEINWVPEHIKHGVFEKTIEQAPDWCISRNRYWATPMPIWEAADGERIVVSSIKEIEKFSGKKVKDLHRPYIDEFIFKKDGKEYKRRKEVLDSWVEAGSMPFAQIHYPFENEKKFEKNFPGDYIVEYTGQVRAWFQRMHIISTILFNSRSFNNVVVTGVMAGSDGRKMSKTYKNYADPKEMLESFGGDALRLYLMGSPLMLSENANFDEEALKTKLKNTLNPLWNSLKYFLIFANEYQWSSDKFEASQDILDKWILIRLNQTIAEISDNIERYTIPPVVRSIEIFVDDLSRWYVRRSRERILQGDDQALSTLFSVLLDFSKISAPVIPFMSEGIYQELKKYIGKNAKKSVHLENYPNYDGTLVKDSNRICQQMSVIRELASTILSLRTERGIGVRQPLNRVAVILKMNVTPDFEHILKDEVNVKRLEFVETLDQKPGYIRDEKSIVALDFNLTGELRVEGRARELIREIQDMRKKQGLSVSDRINVVVLSGDENEAAVLKFGEEIRKKVLARNINFGSAASITKI